MRRTGVELMIWSSRLLLPVAVLEHLWLTWAAAQHGIGVAGPTLLAPGIAEMAWLAVGTHAGAGQVAATGLLVLAGLLAALAGGLVIMGPYRQPATVAVPHRSV